MLGPGRCGWGGVGWGGSSPPAQSGSQLAPTLSDPILDPSQAPGALCALRHPLPTRVGPPEPQPFAAQPPRGIFPPLKAQRAHLLLPQVSSPPPPACLLFPDLAGPPNSSPQPRKAQGEGVGGQPAPWGLSRCLGAFLPQDCSENCSWRGSRSKIKITPASLVNTAPGAPCPGSTGISSCPRVISSPVAPLAWGQRGRRAGGTSRTWRPPSPGSSTKTSPLALLLPLLFPRAAGVGAAPAQGEGKKGLVKCLFYSFEGLYKSAFTQVCISLYRVK